MTNWIELPNRFSLARVPDWFLTELAAYDSQLVLFFSQEEGVYRLARRHQGQTPFAFAFVKHRPDTQVYVHHRLIPVTSILPSPYVQWGPVVLRDLAERDTWRFGGGAAAADVYEQHEARGEAAERRAMLADLDGLSREAYRSYKTATGQRTSLATPARARRRTRPLDFPAVPPARNPGGLIHLPG